jgi:hypothetical protein
MRWTIFIGLVCLGGLFGLAAALGDDTSTKVGMAFLGALFATPVAAIVARRRGSTVQVGETAQSIEHGGSTSPSALARNYWRDRGHPPNMKPSESDPDKHMFDPDRLA